MFTWNPLVTCRRYGPRKQSHILAINEYDISVFPIERQGRLLHNTFNFGANCPLHLSIPAYHLPVYASRCLLPHIAQDSVLDCWLSFVKAVIADHSLPCASRRNPHRSPPADFPHYALQNLIHSTFAAIPSNSVPMTEFPLTLN